MSRRPTRFHLTPEERLLLAAIPDTGGEEQIERLLRTELDWPAVFRMALQEKAASDLWRRVAHLLPTGERSHHTQPLRQLAMVTDFRQSWFEDWGHAVVDLLGSRDIETVLLKGVAVAGRTYGRFSIRPMADLDVLTKPDRAKDAWNLLQEHGWVWRHDLFPMDTYRAFHHLPPLVHRGYPASRIEIHRALLPQGHPFLFSPEAVWERSDEIMVDRIPVRVPHIHDLLLHICLHFAWSHQFQTKGWRTLRDIWVLVNGTEIDWEEFARQAEASCSRTCSYWTLRLARNLTGADIPQTAIDSLRPPLAGPALDRLERHHALSIFRAGEVCPSISVRNFLWRLAIRPRWSGHQQARPWRSAIETPRPTTGLPTAPNPSIQRAVSVARHLTRLL